MLRASSELHEESVDLRGAVTAQAESGVPHGPVLLVFAEAVVARDDAAIAAARDGLVDAMGEEAMIDAAGVASNFERMVRIADATGIPLGEQMEAASTDYRSELGIDAFRHG